jgi:hypothetical protein
MADVYENAFVVIAASICSDPEESFLTRRPSWQCEPHVIAWDDSEDVVPLLYARKCPELGRHMEIENGRKDPLDSRGWAFQEFQLARRCINFTAEEIHWFCRQGQRCECKHAWGLPRLDLAATGHWTDIANQYSYRSLTFLEDRLPALSGVAAKFQRYHPGIEYIAGLWNSDDLPYQLAWYAIPSGGSYSIPVGAGTPAPPYRAPTFSWASIDRAIQWLPDKDQKKRKDSRRFIEVLDVDCRAISSNPYGEVSQGYIRLRGKLARGTLALSDNRYFLTAELPSRPLLFYPDTLISSGEVLSRDGKREHTAHRSANGHIKQPFSVHVWYLRLLSTFTPILLGRSLLHAGTFERLGLVSFDPDSGVQAEVIIIA